MTDRHIYQVLSRSAGASALKADGQAYFNHSDSAKDYIYGQIATLQRFNEYIIGDVEYVIVELPVVFKQDFLKELGSKNEG